MSTILKALRRLEEEDAKGESAASQGANVDAASAAGHVLRDRILAEEVAAEALPPESGGGGHRSQKLVVIGVAAAAIFVLAVGAIWFLESSGGGVNSPSGGDSAADRFAGVDPSSSRLPRVAAEAPVPRPTRPRAPLPVPRAIVNSEPSPAGPVAALELEKRVGPDSAREEASAPAIAPPPTPPAPLAIAAVTPTPAAAAAGRRARDISSLPEARVEYAGGEMKARATRASRETEVAVARPMPSHEASPRVKTTPSTSTADALDAPPTSSPARPASPPPSFAESRAAGAPAVERIDDRGLPDIVVLRTSWHPSADRRSAKLRVVSSDETLTLREGDAVGGLVLQEITPSSVLFQAGDVEIRRKVGASH